MNFLLIDVLDQLHPRCLQRCANYNPELFGSPLFSERNVGWPKIDLAASLPIYGQTLPSLSLCVCLWCCGSPHFPLYLTKREKGSLFYLESLVKQSFIISIKLYELNMNDLCYMDLGTGCQTWVRIQVSNSSKLTLSKIWIWIWGLIFIYVELVICN